MTSARQPIVLISADCIDMPRAQGRHTVDQVRWDHDAGLNFQNGIVSRPSHRREVEPGAARGLLDKRNMRDENIDKSIRLHDRKRIVVHCSLLRSVARKRRGGGNWRMHSNMLGSAALNHGLPPLFLALVSPDVSRPQNPHRCNQPFRNQRIPSATMWRSNADPIWIDLGLDGSKLRGFAPGAADVLPCRRPACACCVPSRWSSRATRGGMSARDRRAA